MDQVLMIVIHLPDRQRDEIGAVVPRLRQLSAGDVGRDVVPFFAMSYSHQAPHVFRWFSMS